MGASIDVRARGDPWKASRSALAKITMGIAAMRSRRASASIQRIALKDFQIVVLLTIVPMRLMIGVEYRVNP